MVRLAAMANRIFRPDRRELMAGLGAMAMTAAVPGIAAAERRPALVLRARPGAIALRQGAPQTPIWLLEASSPPPILRFEQGDIAQTTFLNELPAPIVLNWRGLDRVALTEPLAARSPLPAGSQETVAIPLTHYGTLLCDIKLTSDGAGFPSMVRAIIVKEREPVAVDRDEFVLIEDFRLRTDGSAIAPGSDPKGTIAVYTVNGTLTPDIVARGHERLRLRFINGCQRNVIAVRIEGHEVRIMAMDSQPAEPFLARNGAVVLAPGGRIDAFIDVTAPAGSISSILLHDGKEARPIARLVTSNEPPLRAAALPAAPPLPSNGLPAQLDLKGAMRFDVGLGGPLAGWVTPAGFAATTAPAFRAKTGRTVVLTLSNPTDIPAVFHLHGHHFRLLDRLDDGWKPFWLDTLAVEPGQTQRIAFAAEHAGRWLLESTATDWAAPRLVRWYSVE
jgi:FtsP/CotA-like multicopper oxidase with cupredoxin domain